MGPLKKDPHGRGGRAGEGVGGSICRVLRGSEALGGSFVCVLRVGEALGANGAKGPGVSAKERHSRAWGDGEGEGGEVRFVVFYEGLRLWEAHLYVFYVSGRLSGGRVSNEAWRSCDAGWVR